MQAPISIYAIHTSQGIFPVLFKAIFENVYSFKQRAHAPTSKTTSFMVNNRTNLSSTYFHRVRINCSRTQFLNTIKSTKHVYL